MPLHWTRNLRRAGVGVVTGAVVGVALAGCSGPESPDGAGCPSPTVAPAAELERLPAGLTFESIGPVARVVNTDGHITVQASSTQPMDDLTVAIQDAVTKAGYRPAGMDNEGFEAEVFFTTGTYAAGQALVRAGDCEGRWDIDLVLVDTTRLPGASPSVSPNGSPSPS